MDLLLPREVEFFKLLNEQAEVLVECSIAFEQFVSGIEKMSNSEIEKITSKIKEIESRGDDIETKIIDKLHSAFITPIDREDLHLIVFRMDNSIDVFNETAQKIKMYDVKKMPKNILKFAKIMREASLGMQNLIKHLEIKNSMEEIQHIIHHIHDLEGEGDILFQNSMAELFKKEKCCTNIIKFKDIYEQLENGIDELDDIAKRIRGVVVKQG